MTDQTHELVETATPAAGKDSTWSAGGQVVAALALGAVIMAGLWGLNMVGGSSTASGKPATCAPPKATDSPEYPALCAALNRPDLPALLGTPTEHVSEAQSGGGPITFADGTKHDDASAEIQTGPINVRLTDNQELPFTDYTTFLGPKSESTSVLGHPAVTYSDHTTAIGFSLNGGHATTSPGGIARHLVVAKGTQGGGSFELTIWRQDDQTPDDAALFRTAVLVLPSLQGWGTGS
ncbi:DUF6215 domain-containing protein [Kitasatospora acidiphila]|uniref:DUF6215 domain-containing protein n=1 Tax=Kitasatospora acidiphila TaxID=2567942 RepID=UPI003C773DC5